MTVRGRRTLCPPGHTIHALTGSTPGSSRTIDASVEAGREELATRTARVD